MKKSTKYWTSVFLAIFFFLAIMWIPSFYFNDQSGLLAISFFVFLVAWIVSVLAVIHYSRTGWSLRGSSEEWATAGIMNPLMYLLRGKADEGSRGPFLADDQTKQEEWTNRMMDDRYYRKRSERK